MNTPSLGLAQGAEGAVGMAPSDGVTPGAPSASVRAAVAGVLLATLLLAGCGQKGPLYLPDQTKKSSVPPNGGPVTAPRGTPTPPQTPAESTTPDAPAPR